MSVRHRGGSIALTLHSHGTPRGGHWNARLSNQERVLLIDWVEKEIEFLSRP